jgi:hypothetical protein
MLRNYNIDYTASGAIEHIHTRLSQDLLFALSDFVY